MLLSRRHRRQLVFWLGIAALIGHLLAGAAHPMGGKMSTPANISSGLVEICTPQGITLVDVLSGKVITQPASPQDAPVRCCDLCGASDAPTIAEADPDQVRDAIYHAHPVSPPPQAVVVAARHPALAPLVPRGPPAVS